MNFSWKAHIFVSNDLASISLLSVDTVEKYITCPSCFANRSFHMTQKDASVPLSLKKVHDVNFWACERSQTKRWSKSCLVIINNTGAIFHSFKLVWLHLVDPDGKFHLFIKFDQCKEEDYVKISPAPDAVAIRETWLPITSIHVFISKMVQALEMGYLVMWLFSLTGYMLSSI